MNVRSYSKQTHKNPNRIPKLLRLGMRITTNIPKWHPQRHCSCFLCRGFYYKILFLCKMAIYLYICRTGLLVFWTIFLLLFRFFYFYVSLCQCVDVIFITKSCIHNDVLVCCWKKNYKKEDSARTGEQSRTHNPCVFCPFDSIHAPY